MSSGKPRRKPVPVPEPILPIHFSLEAAREIWNEIGSSYIASPRLLIFVRALGDFIREHDKRSNLLPQVRPRDAVAEPETQ